MGRALRETHQPPFRKHDGYRFAPPILRLAVAMTGNGNDRHCEERSDEAIHACFAERWIASLAFAMTGKSSRSVIPVRVADANLRCAIAHRGILGFRVRCLASIAPE